MQPSVSQTFSGHLWEFLPPHFRPFKLARFLGLMLEFRVAPSSNSPFVFGLVLGRDLRSLGWLRR